MIALDTNVVVRYLMMDEPDQGRRAAALIDRAVATGEPMYLSLVVLCEVTWVLRGAYRLEKSELVTAISGLMRSAQLELEGADIASRALRRYRSGAADFADYVIAERAAAAGCTTLATFDRKLLREADAVEP